MYYNEISASELEKLILEDSPMELIDVREKLEWDMIRIPGAKLIPLSVFWESISKIDTSKPVYIFCRTGSRSGQVCAYLQEQDIRATNVSGSIRALYEKGSNILEITAQFQASYLQ